MIEYAKFVLFLHARINKYTFYEEQTKKIAAYF